jgi:hypothetical protein
MLERLDLSTFRSLVYHKDAVTVAAAAAATRVDRSLILAAKPVKAVIFHYNDASMYVLNIPWYSSELIQYDSSYQSFCIVTC